VLPLPQARARRRQTVHASSVGRAYKTSIVIVVRAYALFVVTDSQLAERGSHDELLAAGGFYSGLYNIQFGEPALAYLAARLS
jgi:hypothetical protein